MGANTEQTESETLSEETGKVDSLPTPPTRGDHPMFWGDPDFNPMLRKKSGDDF